MCGIVGFWRAQGVGTPERDAQVISAMSNAMQHRGPDSSGVWSDVSEGIYFGHRRLAIIDLSPDGHQPMHSGSGRFVITFNGEIYNYLAIRAELAQRGVRFRSNCDTEALVEAIDSFGVRETLQRIHGMFAFALWDRKERSLTLARDRFGKKPLYFAKHNDTVWFASELSALRIHPDFGPAINRHAAVEMLVYGYVPGELSIYDNCCKLAPGSFIRISHPKALVLSSESPALKNDGSNCSDTVVRYWSAAQRFLAAESSRTRVQYSESALVDQLDILISQAVQDRMISDVPLGAFLSGGIDSSLVVAIMSKLSDAPVCSYSIGFEDPDLNEAPYAKEVANYLGLKHTEQILSESDLLAIVPKMASVYDEPFADSSQIPTYLLSQITRQGVTVALSGDGGDEIFGGYPRYFWAEKLMRIISWLPRSIRLASSHLVDYAPAWSIAACAAALRAPAIHKDDLELIKKRRQRLRELLKVADFSELYNDFLIMGDLELARQLGEGDLRAGTNIRELISQLESSLGPKLSRYELMMLTDTLAYLPGDILTKVDRASMAVSLEVRCPLLDTRVAEFAWGLPLGMKIRSGQGKQILRQLLYRYVPQRLVDRPKQGFGVPLERWLHGPLRSWAATLLCDIDNQIIPRQEVQRVWQEFLAGHPDRATSVWKLVALNGWIAKQ